MKIRIVPLGAGQDVGRSCVITQIGSHTIMFDCGIHMGYHDRRRFPNFQYISRTGNFNHIDCVIISHFHLDHCGALPYFTEVCGYTGPVYMTYPTKMICPILLEDLRKVVVERQGDQYFYSSENIKNCMKKVTAVSLNSTIKVDDELEITAFYAGHVLGAAMFLAKSNNETVLYTGDYNMTPDRHLGAAKVPAGLKPDVLITETTYATMIRDSKREREQNFLMKVHKCIERGGKVLIPVFAVGRAQELCILLETYWRRMNLTAPIYFSAGLTERANQYYRLYVGWTNEKIKSTFHTRNMFDFTHINAWDRSLADAPGPMVLLATPGMLHAGLSLEMFKLWCPDEKNLVILPGYCISGTVGNKLLTMSGRGKKIDLGKQHSLKVSCGVSGLSFSAHADAKGIMQLISETRPGNVVLVHGDKKKMIYLKKKIEQEFKIPCFHPANGSTIFCDTRSDIPVLVSTDLIEHFTKTETVKRHRDLEDDKKQNPESKKLRTPIKNIPFKGVLISQENKPLKLMRAEEAMVKFGIPKHTFTFEVEHQITHTGGKSQLQFLQGIHSEIARDPCARDNSVILADDEQSKNCVKCQSVKIRFKILNLLLITWEFKDDLLGERMNAILKSHVDSFK